MRVMAPKPLDQVTLGDLVTKDDLKDLVTKDELATQLGSLKQELRQEFKQELGSAVNLIMGEIGKLAAQQVEMSRTLARLVAKVDGIGN
ncbi:hypothetical protein [Actinomadura madurae]|uniref:hypothetical protein n=2 Tax=Actinomadura madurae TaxID=1993 RepID=UPI0020D211ED|nr:hypothetical protein [Actinomadura madurae]MCP9955109.1 hypothetical protein [Actinomadura madurae]MCP9971839.1 hypothetical protein [Actinomadura madurae]MCP9984345.1 hypothetical protein [Actinomadura madurae]MCQ0004101.1 hypothetical protein [Actinomadura madurae]MCQ0020539.1 hypothetical protein [Actinomadura madurae]